MELTAVAVVSPAESCRRSSFRKWIRHVSIHVALSNHYARDQASPSSDVYLLNRRRPLGVADCYNFIWYPFRGRDAHRANPSLIA